MRLFVLLIAIWFPAFCAAQNALPKLLRDSLWTDWADELRPDTVRHQSMVMLIKKGYMYSQPDSALYYATLLSESDLAKRNVNVHADALNLVGSAHYVQGNVDEAVSLFKRCMDLRQSIDDQKGVAGALNNIGSVYFSKGRYSEAIEYFERSLAAKEAVGDLAEIPSTLNNIANILVNQGDFIRAMDLNLRSLSIREELGDLPGMSSTLNNIGIIHGEMGDHLLAIEHFERSLILKEQLGILKGVAGTHGNMALIYLTLGDRQNASTSFGKALSVYQTLGDKRGEASTLAGLGDLVLTYADHVAAKGYYIEALRLFQEIQDPKGAAATLGRLAKVHHQVGEADVAIVYGNRALAMAQETGLVAETKDAAEILYGIHRAKGAFQQALEMHELFVSMRDSTLRAENQREVMRQQFQYDYGRREALMRAEQESKDALAREQLTRQRSQRNLMGQGFLVLIITGGGTGLFLHQRRKAEYRYRSSRAELKALQAQMRPHFIFNALNSVHNYIERNETAAASDYLIRFSKLMRTTLNSTLSEQVPLSEEMASWTNYIELERPNMRHGLDFRMETGPEVDVERVLIPPLLVQPLLENALWHGLVPKMASGSLVIRVTVADGLLIVSVEDDGVGRDSTASGTDRHPGQDSVGLTLVRERIALLDGGGTPGTGLFLTDLPNGFRSVVRLPFKAALASP